MCLQTHVMTELIVLRVFSLETSNFKAPVSFCRTSEQSCSALTGTFPLKPLERRYIRVSGEATVRHVELFIRRKMELSPTCQVSAKLTANEVTKCHGHGLDPDCCLRQTWKRDSEEISCTPEL